mmetsp:Transcript_50323/g.100214  ORF Transcript_50323/g.100214 Transcript_50323/m.100214 type:complete len:80 (+) Transcript_50323:250-489(+)
MHVGIFAHVYSQAWSGRSSITLGFLGHVLALFPVCLESVIIILSILCMCMCHMPCAHACSCVHLRVLRAAICSLIVQGS